MPEKTPDDVWRAFDSLFCLLLGMIWLVYWTYRAKTLHDGYPKQDLEFLLYGFAGMVVMNLIGIVCGWIEIHYRTQPSSVVLAGLVLNIVFIVLTGVFIC